MNKIYTVTISFEDWESSTWNTIGYFTDIKLAEETKKKWEDFFEFKKNEILDSLKCSDGSFENDEIEDEWYSRILKYSELYTYSEIKLEELPLNIDIFVDQKNNRSKDMQNVILQWERDYKINKIL